MLNFKIAVLNLKHLQNSDPKNCDVKLRLNFNELLNRIVLNLKSSLLNFKFTFKELNLKSDVLSLKK